MGLRTPLGLSVSSVVPAVQASMSAFADHPYMVGKSGRPILVSMDAVLPEDMVGADRMVELALSAASEAVDSTGLPSNFTAAPVDVLVGLPSDRPGVPSALTAVVSGRLQAGLSESANVVGVECFRRGHTSGLFAALRAAQRLRQGNAALCLVGAVDSYIEPESLEWIDDGGSLHSEENPCGFIPGEAAGFCALTTREGAERLGLSVSGNLAAIMGASENKRNGPDTVCLGEGLTAAMRKALRLLGDPDHQVGLAIGDLNGQPERADEFAYTIVRLADYFADPSNILTPAEYWGDIGAATGIASVILSCSIAEARQPGAIDLLFASSDQGDRMAVLMKH